jgi:hypothetical protein
MLAEGSRQANRPSPPMAELRRFCVVTKISEKAVFNS